MSSRLPLLFSRAVSSSSWRVRAALAFKGIEYSTRTIDLSTGENLTDKELGNVNPMRAVPAMYFPATGKTLTQSLAIIDFLENSYPNAPSLLPKDPYNRAFALKLSLLVVADIQPVQNIRVVEQAIRISHDPKQGSLWPAAFISYGFKALEKELLISAGKYCVGDELTLADVCLVPQVYNATKKYGMNLDNFPKISGLYQTILEHPAILASCPENQFDFK
eukprot:TRINITY_DN11993_c0_g1_i1.p1 TRINITY_DN11993_c0_g1~~TRINITY_DN11993_c0_g1_i1.p1  ORF type:complete len:220 (+),score=51.74 TRINITY_DN11993_c0_g1_i1:28-687(+)